MHIKRVLFTAVLIFLFGQFSFAQEDLKQQIIENRIEQLIENLDEDSEPDFTAIFEDLVYFYDHPLNLNNASVDELKSLYLLNEFQILSLHNHIEKHGKLLSIFELQAVEGFDLNTINLLYPFVKVKTESEIKNLSWSSLLHDGNSDLFLRYLTVLEEQEGYSDISEEELAENPNRRYLGNNARYYLRYRYKYRKNLSFGITAEKDPGEEFFTGTQKNGFDFYSAHLYYSGSGIVKKIALGDFAIDFGQGVTFQSSQSFGKSAYSMNIKKAGSGIRPYSSVEENKFMRGVGVTLAWKNWEWTNFYSSKFIDGNIIEVEDTIDGPNELFVSSFQTSGFHSTINGLEDKDAIKEVYYGTNLRYKKRQFSVGMSAYQSEYGGNLSRSLRSYSQFDFNNNENSVVGLDYHYIKNNYHVFGEVSRSESGGFAFLNGLILALDPHFSVSILHRHYEVDYQNLLSNAFAESSSTSNERGLYIGGELKFSRKWNIVGYFDQYKFPWLTFRSDAPSSGFDYLTQLTYKPSRGSELYIRYRHEEKDRNDSSVDAYIDSPITESKSYLRIHSSYKVSESVKLKSRVEWMHYEFGEKDEEGFLFYQDIQFKKLEWPFSLSLRYALFDTDSYDSRIYAYENDLLYTWSVPAYQDKGSRFYVMIKWRLFRKTDLWVRYSQWQYDNRETISSGLNEINGNTKSELKIQLRVRF